MTEQAKAAKAAIVMSTPPRAVMVDIVGSDAARPPAERRVRLAIGDTIVFVEAGDVPRLVSDLAEALRKTGG
jgi:hypothetical protein